MAELRFIASRGLFPLHWLVNFDLIAVQIQNYPPYKNNLDFPEKATLPALSDSFYIYFVIVREKTRMYEVAQCLATNSHYRTQLYMTVWRSPFFSAILISPGGQIYNDSFRWFRELYLLHFYSNLLDDIHSELTRVFYCTWNQCNYGY